MNTAKIKKAFDLIANILDTVAKDPTSRADLSELFDIVAKIDKSRLMPGVPKNFIARWVLADGTPIESEGFGNPVWGCLVTAPPEVVSDQPGVQVLYTPLGDDWIARWHSGPDGRPVLRAIFPKD